MKSYSGHIDNSGRSPSAKPGEGWYKNMRSYMLAALTEDAPMSCPHPNEERQLVYEGSTRPKTDRLLCGLCGEIVYVPDVGAPGAEPEGRPALQADRIPGRGGLVL